MPLSLTPGEQARIEQLTTAIRRLKNDDGDLHELAKLASEYDDIIVSGRRRNKAERDAEVAAAERADVRSAMCGECFMIHRPGQADCE